PGSATPAGARCTSTTTSPVSVTPPTRSAPNTRCGRTRTTPTPSGCGRSAPPRPAAAFPAAEAGLDRCVRARHLDLFPGARGDEEASPGWAGAGRDASGQWNAEEVALAGLSRPEHHSRAGLLHGEDRSRVHGVEFVGAAGRDDQVAGVAYLCDMVGDPFGQFAV